MNKKLWCLLISIGMIFTMLSGCASQSRPDQEQINDISQDAVMALPTEAAKDASGEGTEEDNSPTNITYEYEQELNVLEDNYRNYYEIFVYSFYDSNGDGIGDFAGVISKLDYVKEMGFNGIWLMPINPSPSYHKYDVTDYYEVDSQYGTLEDFKNLIAECHKRDIRLIIDYVFNHTSTKHPWFIQAVEYLKTLKEDEKPDPSICPSVGYYNFTKENKGNGDYYKVAGTDYYYEGVFWDQMPDLALDNKELRTEIEKNVKFWLDMGVDGFRLDAVKEYYSGETGKNVEVLKWFSEYVTSLKANAFIVGECWDSASVIASYYQSGLPSIFNYPLAGYNGIIVSSVRKLGTSNAKSLVKNLMKLQEQYRANNPDYIDSPFLSNHDNTRISAQCANDVNQMKMAAGILLTLNGSPFVYYGEEIGMNSKGDKDENKRLPMQWSSTDLIGMTKPPRGAEAVEQKFPPLEEQLKDPLSIVNYYKRGLRIRNENPEIARGEMSILDEYTTENVCAIKKVYEGSEIVILYNIGKEEEQITLGSAGLEQFKIRGYLTVDSSAVTLQQEALSLPPYSIAILKP